MSRLNILHAAITCNFQKGWIVEGSIGYGMSYDLLLFKNLGRQKLMCRILITKAVDFLNAVPFREKVSWFRLRIIPLFTFNRWCASHKTFSFLTSSFLGFGSIRWIWHITHKIQEDSISKKASSWEVKLFDKSPVKVRSTSSLVNDENGVFGELFFLFDIKPLPSRIYTEILGVFRYGEFLNIVWFWYEMELCLKILVWEVVLHLSIYLSSLSLFFC